MIRKSSGPSKYILQTQAGGVSTPSPYPKEVSILAGEARMTCSSKCAAQPSIFWKLSDSFSPLQPGPAPTCWCRPFLAQSPPRTDLLLCCAVLPVSSYRANAHPEHDRLAGGFPDRCVRRARPLSSFGANSLWQAVRRSPPSGLCPPARSTPTWLLLTTTWLGAIATTAKVDTANERHRQRLPSLFFAKRAYEAAAAAVVAAPGGISWFARFALALASEKS